MVIDRRQFLRLGATASLYLLTGCNPFNPDISVKEYRHLKKSISTIGYPSDIIYSMYHRGKQLKLFLPDIHTTPYTKEQKKRIQDLDAHVTPDIIGIEGLHGEINNTLMNDAKKEYSDFINNWFKSIDPQIRSMSVTNIIDLDIFLNFEIRKKFQTAYPHPQSPGLLYFDTPTKAKKIGMESPEEYAKCTELVEIIQSKVDIIRCQNHLQILETASTYVKDPVNVYKLNLASDFIKDYIPQIEDFLISNIEKQAKTLQPELHNFDIESKTNLNLPDWFTTPITINRSKSWLQNTDAKYAMIIGGSGHSDALYDACNNKYPIITIKGLE